MPDHALRPRQVIPWSEAIFATWLMPEWCPAV